MKARNVVRCGSVERMGLASEVKPGVWSGLNVDICRAIAAAVLKNPNKIKYHFYETDKDFDAVRNQQDDVYFLTGSEINAQNCHAIAGEVTELAQLGLDSGINRLSSRILPESVSFFPVIAATGTQDAQWSTIVAWTVTTLINADRPQTQWYGSGSEAMPIFAPELGLDRQWQNRILKSVGKYSNIFERNLGKILYLNSIIS